MSFWHLIFLCQKREFFNNSNFYQTYTESIEDKKSNSRKKEGTHMSTFVSQITVLVIVGMIVLTVLALFGYLPKKEKQSQRSKRKSWEEEPETEESCFHGFPFERTFESGMETNTQFMNFWVMEQLDQNGKCLKVFEISKVPEKGLVIGSANDCDIKISGSRFVGRHHAAIGQDEKGLFLQDLDSTNGMFDQNTKKIKQLEITDRKEAYLANVKIRFRAINPFQTKSDSKESKKEEKKEEGSSFGKKMKRL